MNKRNSQTTKKELKFAILATDVVLLTMDKKVLKVLLVETAAATPFPKMKTLPGGLISPNETAEAAVERHLAHKAGVSGAELEQLYTFSSVKRDPRGRVVSVAYLGLRPTISLGTKERPVYWQDVRHLPRLAYDHNEIVSKGVERLMAKLSYTTIAKGLLPEQFTLSELQSIYESILHHEFDKRNFRKKVLALGCLKKLGAKRRGEAHRPADLYRFVGGGSQVFEIL
ncbi:MAG: NUDIX domain-containing protein [Patescibacteria group bacterium]